MGTLAASPAIDMAGAANVCELGMVMSRHVGRTVPHDGYLFFGLDPVTGVASFHDRSPGLGRRAGTGGFPGGDFGGEMRITLTCGKLTWGGLVLLRGRDVRPFSAVEAARAERLAGPLGATLKRFLAVRPTCAPRPVAPGVVIVGADDAISATTPAGHDWLDGFGPAARSAGAFALLTHRARRAPGPVLSRVPVAHGWSVVHVQRLDASLDDEIALTFQTATASALLPVVAALHDLTARERTVVEHAMAGLPAKQIARRLDLSPYTVNDHFKAVYRKVGVAGRDELLAALSG
ncbi:MULTISPECIES: helix-turn-helix transcriptional regulator [Actinomadura]|uniref:Helix-turn-helix transcriptional regulator n=1 Tax=Actinomadura yumaensis TaxID=111807 RepID=A0ABW2CQK2_9ACTN|nr:helix-turn-helix transcriptional regulator [Actinomadura sp. J1-007]MWK37544.1 hypothetical protein [Actinomadura sp. J1-007]